jgi:hypothetical protein
MCPCFIYVCPCFIYFEVLLNVLEFYFDVLLNMLEFYFEVLLNMLEFYFEVLLNMLEFYFEVLLNMLEFYFEVLLNMLEFYFEILLNMLQLLLMHVPIFSTLGQPWLESIRNSRRVRLETATGDLLLPRARRWEALAVGAPLLILHPMTLVWRCGRCLLLLRHTWMTPPRPPWATTRNALTPKR